MKGRKPGNPNWGKPINISQEPVVPTMFECLCAKLGLDTERKQLASSQLKDWSKRNFKTRFVPETLILSWGLADRFDLESVDYTWDGRL